MPVYGILIMDRPLQDKGEIGILLLIKYVSVLSEGFVTVGFDTYLLEIVCRLVIMSGLSAVTLF